MKIPELNRCAVQFIILASMEHPELVEIKDLIRKNEQSFARMKDLLERLECTELVGSTPSRQEQMDQFTEH